MVVQNDHVAAAAYLMKRADATALIVTQAHTGVASGIRCKRTGAVPVHGDVRR
jgi:hypothetical protein